MFVARTIPHDTIEDTPLTQGEVKICFGTVVTTGVAAAREDGAIPNEWRIAGALRRFHQARREVAMVSLAYRILNLAELSSYYTRNNNVESKPEWKVILAQLGHPSTALATRLAARIEHNSLSLPAALEPSPQQASRWCQRTLGAPSTGRWRPEGPFP